MYWDQPFMGSNLCEPCSSLVPRWVGPGDEANPVQSEMLCLAAALSRLPTWHTPHKTAVQIPSHKHSKLSLHKLRHPVVCYQSNKNAMSSHTSSNL